MVWAVVPLIQGEVPPPIVTAATTPEVLAAFSALIIAAFGVMTANLSKRLTQIKRDTETAKEQVTNHHDTNLRDDLTKVIGTVEKLTVQVAGVAEIQRSQGHQLGEIRDQQIQDSRDRQALDRRLQALDESAEKAHASIWDYIRRVV